MGKEIKKRGRPRGMRAIQLELQEELYSHPDNQKVVDMIYAAALDNNHKNQAACMKLLMDRMLPISVCEKQSDSRQKIQINIGQVKVPNREEKVINELKVHA